MFNNLKKSIAQNKIGATVGAVALTAVNSQAAALTATDVPMGDTTSSIGIVFLAMLGVSVLIYGYRKIAGMLGR